MPNCKFKTRVVRGHNGIREKLDKRNTFAHVVSPENR